jgi:hypothetical protein
MSAEPFIPRNRRNIPPAAFTVKNGVVTCPANLEMPRRGKMTVKDRTYIQYICPIHWRKKCRRQYLLCPASHPKFFSQKGCNYLVRLTPTVRDQIAYGTQRFKLIYNQRTSVERIFSRLLAISIQRPTVIGLAATTKPLHDRAHHRSACRPHRSSTGPEDKIRYVRSFLPSLMLK